MFIQSHLAAWKLRPITNGHRFLQTFCFLSDLLDIFPPRGLKYSLLVIKHLFNACPRHLLLSGVGTWGNLALKPILLVWSTVPMSWQLGNKYHSQSVGQRLISQYGKTSSPIFRIIGNKLDHINLLRYCSVVAPVMGAYFTLIDCPYITSVELVDVSDMLYIGNSLYILAHWFTP